MLLSLLCFGWLHSARASIVYKGSDCEYIRLTQLPSNSGCDDGDKFVIKQVSRGWSALTF